VVPVAPARAPHRLPRPDRLDQPPHVVELRLRQLGERLPPQQLLAAPRTRRERPGSAVAVGRRAVGRRLEPDDRPLCPGRCLAEDRCERRVEPGEVVAASGQRLPKRPVDIVAPAKVDLRESAERVANAPRPRLEARAAEDTPERDYVAQ
jgi:hypothetical protein